MLAMRLDHVSITAPAGALEDLGFVVTQTGGARGDHARVYLDRVYLEVTAGPGLAGRGWFLRPDDVTTVARDLRERGVTAADPVEYRGRDGTWLDVELREPALEGPAPILTRRIDVPHGAWPPSLPVAHPNGSRRIKALTVSSPVPDALAHALRVLGGAAPVPGRIRWPDGAEIVITAAPSGRGGLVSLETDRRVRLDLAPP